MRELSSRGVKVTATAIFNDAQATMAAHQGAYSVAPYIHRINNKGYKGVDTAVQIQNVLTVQHYDTEILAAAFESVGQVMEVIASGAASLTVAPDLLMEIFFNIITEDAVKDFEHDFQTQFKQKSMLANTKM
ncbi:MAG: transaldolase family protein [Hungatella sp.]